MSCHVTQNRKHTKIWYQESTRFVMQVSLIASLIFMFLSASYKKEQKWKKRKKAYIFEFELIIVQFRHTHTCWFLVTSLSTTSSSMAFKILRYMSTALAPNCKHWRRSEKNVGHWKKLKIASVKIRLGRTLMQQYTRNLQKAKLANWLIFNCAWSNCGELSSLMQ